MSLVWVALGIFIVNPSFPTAFVIIAMVAFAGLVEWRRPKPVKPVEEHELLAFKEDVKNLRAEIGLVKAALGLSKAARSAPHTKISVFKEG